MALSIVSLWEDALSAVTEGVYFNLLPLTPNHSGDDTTTAGGPSHPNLSGGARVTVDRYESPLEEDGSYNEWDFDMPNGASEAPAAGPPPPPPPPPLRTTDSDPYTEAKRRIVQLVNRLKGAGGEKDLERTREEESSENSCLDYNDLDEKGRQWADFQARGHKLKDGRAFITLANKKRKLIDEKLEFLAAMKSGSPEMEAHERKVMSLEEVTAATEVLETAGDWYQGGIRKLKDARPLYKELELVFIEPMIEFCNLRREMSELPSQYSCKGEPQEVLNKTKCEFEKRHRRWGAVIGSNAKGWHDNGFPVCDQQLDKARYYICGLVVQFVEGSLTEAGKVDTSRELPVNNKAKQRLEESVQLLQTAARAQYFSLGQSTNGEKCVDSHPVQNGHPVENEHLSISYSVSELLEQTVEVAQMYFELGIGLFKGYIQNMGKQKICDHFQSILSLLKKIEELVKSLPRDKVDSNVPCRSASTGVLTRLPQVDGLKKRMEQSCLVLCEHVAKQASVFKALPSDKDSEEKQEKTKEMVQWMAFSCKYNCQIHMASGKEYSKACAHITAVVRIAWSFIEDSLKQYNEFVHILDRKRIRSHFDRILKVVQSLVGNIPTSGNSSEEKLLKSLPNSEELVATVMKSCDMLMSHYQEHEINETNILKDPEASLEVIKKRSDKVYKWLAFGGGYLHKMLEALGPDHTREFMLMYEEFEKIVTRMEDVINTRKNVQ